MTIKKSGLLKLSASSIKTYEQCPRKWYFTYVTKEPKKDWPHLALGNFVHKVLELFHERVMNEGAPTDLWGALLSETCKKVVGDFKLSKEHKVSSKDMLNKYLALIKAKPPDVVSNEQNFSIQLTEDTLIRGFIDRIDRDVERGYDIVDYKTGKSKYLDEFQLLVYGLYLLETYPDLLHFRGTYIALVEGPKIITYTFTKTDIERCREDILLVADKIRNDRTWEPKPQFLCSYCDFESICPAVQQAKFAKTDGWVTHSNEKRD